MFGRFVVCDDPFGSKNNGEFPLLVRRRLKGLGRVLDLWSTSAHNIVELFAEGGMGFNRVERLKGSIESLSVIAT